MLYKLCVTMKFYSQEEGGGIWDKLLGCIIHTYNHEENKCLKIRSESSVVFLKLTAGKFYLFIYLFIFEL